jgi:hypothetical protein
MSYRRKTTEDYAREREVRINKGGHSKYSFLRSKFFHGERARNESGWEYPIKLDADAILKRFEDNHNRMTFNGTDEEYFNLIKKAIVICCRMAEHFREDTIVYERYRFDDITISGGGGGGSEYTIYCNRDIAFWNMSIGTVYINFKDKSLKVSMSHWREEGINPFHKVEYCKEVDLKDFDCYKEKYAVKQKEKEETIEDKALKEIEGYSLNLGNMTNNYWFDHYWESGKTFYQVCFYDRRHEYTGALTMISCKKEDKDRLLKEINAYNEKLEELIEKHGEENFLFTDVGENKGYTHVRVHERNKIKESKKRRR